jgi:hypothetical protein
MNRNEWRYAYREARKIATLNRLMPASYRPLSLAESLPLDAWRAACRYGDPLRHPPRRSERSFDPVRRYRSRLSDRAPGVVQVDTAM